MTSLPRRLPRSNATQPNESLAGYLLNLAYRLNVRPKDLVVRTGLKDGPNPSLLDLLFTIAIPTHTRQQFAAATGLTEQEVRNLTIERHRELLQAPDNTSTPARTLHSNLWVSLGRTRYCPQCLSDTNPATPDHALWKLDWLTPWAVACTTHQRLLLDTCPTCRTPTGTSGPNAFASTIPNFHRPVTHPAACRAQNSDHNTGLCDTRLDQTQAPPASHELVALQHELNKLLHGEPHAPLTTLGLPVTPAQRLRDLRLVIILLQLTPHTDTPPPRHVLTQPPPDTQTAAHLLQQAAALLDDPTTADELNTLSRQALQQHTSLWKKAQATGAPSTGLDHAFKDHKNGITDPNKLRAYIPNSHHTYTPNTVPGYLDQATYARHFPDIPNLYQRPIRRCVPITLVRLVSEHDPNTAGQLLGYDNSTTQAACARASDAFDQIGINEFRQRVTRIAAEHNNQNPHPDYQHLRNAFTPNWTIPDNLWAQFQATLYQQKLARADTPWDRRRPAYSTWIWGLITQGDLNTAPMIRTTVNGRQSTNGAAKDIYDLIRRTPPTHQQLVHDLAHQIKDDLAR